jgi:hypothetical protein
MSACGEFPALEESFDANEERPMGSHHHSDRRHFLTESAALAEEISPASSQPRIRVLLIGDPSTNRNGTASTWKPRALTTVTSERLRICTGSEKRSTTEDARSETNGAGPSRCISLHLRFSSSRSRSQRSVSPAAGVV